MSNGPSSPVSQRRLEALMGESIDALSAMLRDREIPARERADIALRLLALGLGLAEGSVVAPAPQSVDAPAPQPANTILPVRFVTIPDFLPPELHAEIVSTALDHRESFSKSTVTTNLEGFRESQVLHSTEFPALYETVKQQITTALPPVLDGLGHTPFDVAQVEMQITGHGDRNFFKVHNDSGSPDTVTREVSYVYYFHAGPRRGFEGGALRIYQTYPLAGVRYDAAEYHEIEPIDNSIVFFDSRLMHEVLPVTVPSGAFEDWRFTINGWLRR
jgi:Rps23 Pro-64 3,4-dihydroxylase Tpa1-like proline 4-hydroxylase